MKHSWIFKTSTRKFLLIIFLLVSIFNFDSLAQYPAGSQVGINAKLSISNGRLVHECGNAIQLRGISRHAPQWFDNCYAESILDVPDNNWDIDAEIWSRFSPILFTYTTLGFYL
ncbi:hypothetical protein JMN32_12755 [Fulvivirga sp. 29W222]|uniref:Uncharacterized protein n=1 Tax=Fulvivirga marina TaxID=2494733 RepID=A0A937KCB0_9BACT|nr:hypothetical protein [Fulvivirga marina]MBL6447184.1 hypothetical protein [Fulvivirga marina]